MMIRYCRICGRSLALTNKSNCCLECRILARAGYFDAEVWLPIVGFKGWEISDRGRVRDTQIHKIREPDRSHRYPRVCLNGHRRYVHQLMAETWLGPRPWGRLVLHDDDDPANMHIANLSYGDHAQNAADAARNRALSQPPSQGGGEGGPEPPRRGGQEKGERSRSKEPGARSRESGVRRAESGVANPVDDDDAWSVS